MNIDKNNIEEYIFDYLEGNLSGKELTDFKSYVNYNAEANDELNAWKQTYVSNTSTISSSEFSSLKKSNKGYYWATGIATAFLLGLGTMALVETEETNEPLIETTTKTIVPTEIIKVKKTEALDEKMEDPAVEIATENIVDNKVTNTENSEIESFEEEDIDQTDQLDIKLEPSSTSRKGSLEKVKIVKTTEPIKKKEEVDVIDIETGF